jgi:hypothetical protein
MLARRKKMGKYERFDNFAQMQQPKNKGIHPIWRGIGCLMLILIPIIAFAAADTFYDNASNLNLFGSTIFQRTGIIYRVFFSFELSDDITLRLTFFHLIFTVIFSVVGFLIISFIYTIIYRFSGPPQYGPTDAPPIRRKKTKKSR